MADSEIDRRVPLAELRQGKEFWWLDGALKQQRAADLLALAGEVEQLGKALRLNVTWPDACRMAAVTCEGLAAEWRRMVQEAPNG